MFLFTTIIDYAHQKEFVAWESTEYGNEELTDIYRLIRKVKTSTDEEVNIKTVGTSAGIRNSNSTFLIFKILTIWIVLI